MRAAASIAASPRSAARPTTSASSSSTSRAAGRSTSPPGNTPPSPSTACPRAISRWPRRRVPGVWNSMSAWFPAARSPAMSWKRWRSAIRSRSRARWEPRITARTTGDRYCWWRAAPASLRSSRSPRARSPAGPARTCSSISAPGRNATSIWKRISPRLPRVTPVCDSSRCCPSPTSRQSGAPAGSPTRSRPISPTSTGSRPISPAAGDGGFLYRTPARPRPCAQGLPRRCVLY